MGFDIVTSGGGFFQALIIVLGISAAIPVVIWFVALVGRARADVVEDNHDLEA